MLCLGPSKSPEKFGARKNIFTFPPGPPKYPGGPIETYKKNFAENFLKYFCIFSHKISVPKIIFYIFSVKRGPKIILLSIFQQFLRKMLKNQVKIFFGNPFNRKKYEKIILGTEILWEKIKKYFENFSA